MIALQVSKPIRVYRESRPYPWRLAWSWICHPCGINPTRYRTHAEALTAACRHLKTSRDIHPVWRKHRRPA